MTVTIDDLMPFVANEPLAMTWSWPWRGRMPDGAEVTVATNRVQLVWVPWHVRWAREFSGEWGRDDDGAPIVLEHGEVPPKLVDLLLSPEPSPDDLWPVPTLPVRYVDDPDIRSTRVPEMDAVEVAGVYYSVTRLEKLRRCLPGLRYCAAPAPDGPEQDCLSMVWRHGRALLMRMRPSCVREGVPLAGCVERGVFVPKGGDQ